MGFAGGHGTRTTRAFEIKTRFTDMFSKKSFHETIARNRVLATMLVSSANPGGTDGNCVVFQVFYVLRVVKKKKIVVGNRLVDQIFKMSQRKE